MTRARSSRYTPSTFEIRANAGRLPQVGTLLSALSARDLEVDRVLAHALVARIARVPERHGAGLAPCVGATLAAGHGDFHACVVLAAGGADATVVDVADRVCWTVWSACT